MSFALCDRLAKLEEGPDRLRGCMNPRMGLVLALLLVGVALTPVALADHAYSHRYIIYGRVLDANGDPVKGVPVDMGTRNFETEGNCAQQPLTETDAFGRTETRFQTNDWGEFIFCYHTHEINRIEPPTGIVRIEEYNYTQEFRFDPYFRTTFLVVRLDTAVPTANKTIYDETYLVMGRLWEDAGARVLVDSIPVFGHTVDRTPVNVTLTLADGTKLTDETSTNNYGDFAVRIPTTERVRAGTVTIEVKGQTFSGDVDASSGATVIHAKLSESAVSRSDTTLIVLGVIVGVAVVGGGGWYALKRVSARREEQAIREGSARKRARR